MATMNGVPFRKMLVPSSKYSLKCPNVMNPKKVTIHATDNQMPANNEISYMRNNNNQVSYHFAADEVEIVQGLPTNRNGWHAGDGGNGYGNRNTIGWEMCRSYDRDRSTTNLNEPLKSQFGKAYDNTVKGVAQLCIDEGIVANKSNLKPHQAWSGKYCPRILFDWKEFDKLVNEIIKEYNRLKGGGKPSEPSKPSKPSTPSKGKSISQMADEVIAGKHGSGHANRRKSLGISQSEYEKVRAEVNRRAGVKSEPKPSGKSIAAMAQEVIAGKHGSGHENRRKSLGISKSEYEKVRAEVNKRSGVSSTPKAKPKKSVSQMAQEVIAGKHGSGHANRRKSLGISQAEYEKVRAEVNKRAGGGGSAAKSTPKKSVSQMATEVIQGKHGSGHANRRKSLGISQAEYEKVRAEVNKRL